MSICSDFDFTPAEINGQKTLNRRLAFLPRLGVVGPFRRAFVRTLLRLGDIGADRKAHRRGVAVDRLAVTFADRPLRFRILRPRANPTGVVLDIHGGAWAFCSPIVDDPANAAIVRASGAVVLALDYELAMPRAVAELQRDAAAALEWLLTTPPADLAGLPVALASESAGAHLALGAAIAVRDDGIARDRLKAMLLHCGAYDLGGTPSALAAGPETLVLHGPSLRRQLEALFPGEDETTIRDPRISPLYADLRDLPPALIVVGDIDPLRDDSRYLADALSKAGNDATLIDLPFAPHAIIHCPGAYANKVRRASARWLAERLADRSNGRAGHSRAAQSIS